MTGLAIFDLDGTLVDSAPACAGIVNDMLLARGSARRISIGDTMPLVSLGGRTMVSALLGETCGDPDAELREFRARYADGPTPADSLYAGVRDGIMALRDAAIPLAICSNKPQNLCEKVLRDLDLANMFDVIVGGGPGIAPKPAPDLLALTLARAGATVQDSVFIGDSELDHQVARAARIPFIFVTYGYSDPKWDFSDAWQCDSFAAVPHQVIDLLRNMYKPRIALRA